MNLERHELVFRAEKSKTRTERVVPISTRLLATLEMRKLDPLGEPFAKDAYVFSDELGRRVKSVRTAWENACDRARLTELQLRDLRHEAGSRFEDAGVPVTLVSKILGHTTVRRFAASSQTDDAPAPGRGTALSGPVGDGREGNPTDDPAVMFASPPGAFLPNGGAYHHKGYAMGLWVEALTAGLSGHGRADPKEGWGSTTFVQLLDSALFGGRAEFERQTTWLANACHATPPRPGVARVRLPGEQGLRLREE